MRLALPSPGGILITGALFWACIGRPARADYQLNPAPGFEGYLRSDSWSPVTVNLTGSGPTGSGQLLLVVFTRDGTTTYSTSVHLRSGALNEQHTITFFYPSAAPPPALIVQLYVEGRKVAEKKLEKTLALTDAQPAILALTQDQSGLNYLQRVDLGLRHVTEKRTSYPNFGGYGGATQGLTGTNPLKVLYPAATALPDSAYSYEGVDAIMLGDLSLDALTENQWNAIVRWVEDGGVLVISGGPDINRLRSPQLKEILPIEPTAAKTVTALSALGERYGAPLKLKSTGVMDGSLKMDAAARCSQGKLPLVAYRRLGNGEVVFTAFDLTDPQFRAWSGEPSLWKEMLEIGIGEIRAIDVVKGVSQTSWSSGYRSLADALGGVQSTEAPSFTFIGAFLLLYIVCLVPLNYFLLRRWDRKELAWITAPVIILLFSTGAYAIGYSIKGGQLFLRYASVVEGTANDDNWDAYTVASVFSPRQTRYDVSVSDSQAVVAEVTAEPGSFQRPVADLAVERDQKTTVKDALVNMWDHRNFAFESHPQLEGHVTASILPSNRGFQVQISNNTKYALSDCIASYRGQFVQIGSMAPGATQAVQLPAGGPQGAGRIGPVALQPPSQTSGAGGIKQALASSVTANETGVQGRDPALFTGWFSDTVQGLSLENETPHVEGTSLLVVHLPVPSSSGAEPAPPYVPPQPRFNPFGPQYRMPRQYTPPMYRPRRVPRSQFRIRSGMAPVAPMMPPPTPNTGSGRRRFVTPAPGGGYYVTIQTWWHGRNGTSSSTINTYVPPGRPLPP